MKNDRHSISRKVARLVAIMAACALIIAAGVSFSGMVSIRMRAKAGGEQLGSTAGQLAQDGLIAQVETSSLNLVKSKAELADTRLEQFKGYVGLLASYAEELYAAPEVYPARMVLPPRAEDKGVLKMQRTFASTDIKIHDVADEVGLLGNLEDVFAPIMAANSSTITTIYIGTESGVLISYDTNADLSADNGNETYYDYFESAWYKQAKNSSGPFFTDTYLDFYGRGLMLSCVAPIRSEDGDFLGAVAMDIAIADLNAEIIAIQIGAHSYTVLLDKNGDIIASPLMEAESDAAFDNIISNEQSPAHEVAEQLLSGESGVVKTSGNIYYAYTPVSSAEWTIAVHIPADDILKPVYTIQSTIAQNTADTVQAMDGEILEAICVFSLAFLLILAAVVLVSVKFSKRLTGPLTALCRDAEEITNGNLGHRSDVSTDDEIGTLAESFNAMSAALQKYIADLTGVTAEKERIGAELSIAAQIQAHMLPCTFPPFPERTEFDIYATMTPAKEVGGDFYDFFMIDDDHLALVMADVSGKGVPAALFMMISETLIKSAAQLGLSPKNVLEKVNDQLCQNNDAEMFVTVWLGILQISTGKLVCANAGHEYPALRRRGGDFELYKDKHGFVLAGMEHAKYREYELTLAPGDTIFVYTDGVPEATNAANELFGTQRMLDALSTACAGTCASLLAQVHNAVDAFAGSSPQFDDITMLALTMNAVAQPGDEAQPDKTKPPKIDEYF